MEYHVTQPSVFRDEYVLKDGESIIGKLVLPGKLRNRGKALFPDGREWTFNPRGFLRKNLVVMKPDSAITEAEFHYNLFRKFSVITMSDSERFLLSFEFFLQTITLSTDLEMPIATYHRKGFLRMNFTVACEPTAPGLNRYPWLLFLPVHLAVLRRRSASHS